MGFLGDSAEETTKFKHKLEKTFLPQAHSVVEPSSIERRIVMAKEGKKTAKAGKTEVATEGKAKKTAKAGKAKKTAKAGKVKSGKKTAKAKNAGGVPTAIVRGRSYLTNEVKVGKDGLPSDRALFEPEQKAQELNFGKLKSSKTNKNIKSTSWTSIVDDINATVVKGVLGRTLRRKQSAMIVNGVFDRLTKIGIETGRLRIPNFAVMSVARRDATKAKKKMMFGKEVTVAAKPASRKLRLRILRIVSDLIEQKGAAAVESKSAGKKAGKKSKKG